MVVARYKVSKAGPSSCIDGFSVRRVVHRGDDRAGRMEGVGGMQERIGFALYCFLVDRNENKKEALHHQALCNWMVSQKLGLLSSRWVGGGGYLSVLICIQ